MLLHPERNLMHYVWLNQIYIIEWLAKRERGREEGRKKERKEGGREGGKGRSREERGIDGERIQIFGW